MNSSRQGSEESQDYGYLNQGGDNQWGTLPTRFDSRGIIEIKLPAESGNDVMVGGTGDDVLYGELGDDVLDGSNARARGAYESVESAIGFIRFTPQS
ncbi:MAG: hypothetical protein AAF716_08565 [Cyanobacteria bacterium P01_D01_bin.1]